MQQSFVADYFFYKRINRQERQLKKELPSGLVSNWWTPSFSSLAAPGIGWSAKAIGLTALSLLTSKRKSYGSLLIANDAGVIVHRTSALTKTPHFPFMEWGDLQFGTWTHPDYRCQGLAEFGLNYVLASEKSYNQTFWYIVRKANAPSIRVAEKCDFEKYAEGHRTKPLGISLFGSFVIDQRIQNSPSPLITSPHQL